MILGITVAVVLVAAAAALLTEHRNPAPARRPVASPLPGVSAAAWGAWLQANVASEAERAQYPDRTPHYGLRPRELADVGLGTSADELEALTRVSRQLAGVLTRSHAALLGTELEGEPASLSGLMAVARYAGLGGLSSWCADAQERARFAETTAAYRRCNGLF